MRRMELCSEAWVASASSFEEGEPSRVVGEREGLERRTEKSLDEVFSEGSGQPQIE